MNILSSFSIILEYISHSKISYIMISIATEYAGLKLKSPIIAGSSGMTDQIDKLIKLEEAGAGAVVIKSLFEEEIIAEMNRTNDQMMASPLIYPDTYDMFDLVEDKNTVFEYLELIKEAKEKLTIPVIASINCQSAQKWTYFARKIQEAGADALELNAFIMPSDFDRPNTADIERTYYEIIDDVLQHTSIPVTLKLSPYFSNLGPFLQQISRTRIKGIVMFNRFFSPDYDLNDLELTPSYVLSSPHDLPLSLRWVAIMHGRMDCDICASTGIHDGNAVVKQILAGANAVQIASALYKHGPEYIHEMTQGLIHFMEEKKFSQLDSFRGKLSQQSIPNPAVFDRVQFIKNFREMKPQ